MLCLCLSFLSQEFCSLINTWNKNGKQSLIKKLLFTFDSNAEQLTVCSSWLHHNLHITSVVAFSSWFVWISFALLNDSLSFHTQDERRTKDFIELCNEQSFWCVGWRLMTIFKVFHLCSAFGNQSIFFSNTQKTARPRAQVASKKWLKRP